MPTYQTVSDLLAAQSERGLMQLRAGILAQFTRLQMELRLVDEALRRKREGKMIREGKIVKAPPTDATASASAPDILFGNQVLEVKHHTNEGLRRQDLLRYFVAMGGGPAGAAEVRDYLASQGVERRVEAVRNGLVRLTSDGELVRVNGKFAVAPRGDHSAEVESADPLSRAGTRKQGAAAPDG